MKQFQLKKLKFEENYSSAKMETELGEISKK